MAPHWHANALAPLAAGAPNCIAVEHFLLAKDIYNFERVVTPASRLQTGPNSVLVPARPGFGIEVDDEAIEHFSVP